MSDSKRLPADDAWLVRVDDALRHWPVEDRSPLDWDEAAARLQARVEAGEIGRTSQILPDDVIFASPLGADPEELQNSGAIRVESFTSLSPQTPLSVPQSSVRSVVRSELETGRREGGSARANATGAVEAKMGVNVERERDRRSFQDLARLASSPAMTQPPPSSAASTPLVGAQGQAGPSNANVRGSSPDHSGSKDDSGLIDLRAMSASEPPPPPVAQPRAALVNANVAPEFAKKPATLLASTGLFEDETAPPSAAVVAAPLSLGPAPTSRVTAPAVHQAQQARVNAEAPKKSGTAMLLGGLMAAAALAAGAFFMVRPQKPADAPMVLVTAQAPVAPEVAAHPATAAPQATVAAAAAPGVNAVDPSTLPAMGGAVGVEKAAAAPAAQLSGAKVARAATAAAPAPKGAAKSDGPAVDPKLVATDLPPSPGIPGSLGEAMKQAAGPTGDNKQEAQAEAEPQFAPGSVPQKPSLGAVSGALGTVLPAARSCIGPDDPISRATVTFKSSGAVSSVTVTGNAAGKPAEACIKAALLKAKVPPFAQDSYPTPVTIRPN